MTKQLLAIIVILLTATLSFAQDGLSAVINIRYEGVEIRRVNSDLWLPLPQNATAFIGAGDQIRTDATGRVDIQFGESAHLLLLSNSDFMIDAYTISDDRRSLDSVLNGNAVIETLVVDDFESFNLDLNDLTVTAPATLMSVWSFPDVKDAVTVASGTAMVSANDTEFPVPAESGYLAEPDRSEAVMFDPEWHAAGLEAGLYGCEGEVQTAGNVALLVRTGPGQGFQAMGTLDVSRVVSLMGMTETTQWTRIQFLTGFGWIRSSAINSTCADLPIFEDNTPEEKFITIVNVTDEELMLLQPFFESPETNAFSYRFISNP